MEMEKSYWFIVEGTRYEECVVPAALTCVGINCGGCMRVVSFRLHFGHYLVLT